MSLLLTGGTLVTALDPPRLRSADLLVRDGRVAMVGVEHDAAPAEARRLDCSGCLVVPGNVCAHSHAYSALARGMPFDLPAPSSFLEILQRIWWRLDRALDPEATRASALVAALDALRAGTTTLVDHHASPHAIDGSLDIVAEAFEEVGLRSVLCYETSDRDGALHASEGLDENARFLRRIEDGRWPLARGMVGAHASFTLSAETLADCVDLARRSSVGVHVHVAEDGVDQADAVARFGKRVGHRLEDAGALAAGALLAHGVHLDPAEAALIVASGATVAHNPRSNMNNGVGRTPLDWLAGRVALGTDGIDGDMFAEAAAAHFRQREERLDAAPDEPLRALARGARMVGRSFDEPLLGRLEAGAPADIAVVEYAAPTPVRETSLAAHWIYGLSAANVRDVLVAGELVLRDRVPTRLDAGEVALMANQATRRLWERLERVPPHRFEPTRLLTSAGSA